MIVLFIDQVFASISTMFDSEKQILHLHDPSNAHSTITNLLDSDLENFNVHVEYGTDDLFEPNIYNLRYINQTLQHISDHLLKQTAGQKLCDNINYSNSADRFNEKTNLNYNDFGMMIDLDGASQLFQNSQIAKQFFGFSSHITQTSYLYGASEGFQERFTWAQKLSFKHMVGDRNDKILIIIATTDYFDTNTRLISVKFAIQLLSNMNPLVKVKLLFVGQKIEVFDETYLSIENYYAEMQDFLFTQLSNKFDTLPSCDMISRIIKLEIARQTNGFNRTYESMEPPKDGYDSHFSRLSVIVVSPGLEGEKFKQISTDLIPVTIVGFNPEIIQRNSQLKQIYQVKIVNQAVVRYANKNNFSYVEINQRVTDYGKYYQSLNNIEQCILPHPLTFTLGDLFITPTVNDIDSYIFYAMLEVIHIYMPTSKQFILVPESDTHFYMIKPVFSDFKDSFRMCIGVIFVLLNIKNTMSFEVKIRFRGESILSSMKFKDELFKNQNLQLNLSSAFRINDLGIIYQHRFYEDIDLQLIQFDPISKFTVLSSKESPLLIEDYECFDAFNFPKHSYCELWWEGGIYQFSMYSDNELLATENFRNLLDSSRDANILFLILKQLQAQKADISFQRFFCDALWRFCVKNFGYQFPTDFLSILQYINNNLSAPEYSTFISAEDGEIYFTTDKVSYHIAGMQMRSTLFQTVSYISKKEFISIIKNHKKDTNETVLFQFSPVKLLFSSQFENEADVGFEENFLELHTIFKYNGYIGIHNEVSELFGAKLQNLTSNQYLKLQIPQSFTGFCGCKLFLQFWAICEYNLKLNPGLDIRQVYNSFDTVQQIASSEAPNKNLEIRRVYFPHHFFDPDATGLIQPNGSTSDPFWITALEYRQHNKLQFPEGRYQATYDAWFFVGLFGAIAILALLVVFR